MSATATTTQYRVIATTTTGFVDPVVKSIVKWEGSDLDQLSRDYPPSEIFGADELFQKEIEDGYIITRFSFEKQNEDGSWSLIDDPRRRITPLTNLEIEMDAENRRLFPGDYDNSCDGCGYDDCQCEGADYIHCRNCSDYGCKRCDPNWCTLCNNEGCASCDPAGVCPSCRNYYPSMDSFSEDSGLCIDYCSDPSLPVHCSRCMGDLKGSEYGMCADCEEYEALPNCTGCKFEKVEGEGKLCIFCVPKCGNCGLPHLDSKLNYDLCNSCQKEESQYFVWWRRALRAVQGMFRS